MKPNISFYAIIFAIALAVAYYVSEDNPDQVQAGQRWLNLQARDFNAASYQDDKGGRLEISRLETGSFWGRYQAEGKEPEEFKVRSTVNNLAKFWAELRVIRVIGAVKDLQLDEFDLADHSQILSLRFGDRDYKYVVGKRGFQTQDHFVLDQQKEQVIMVDRQGLQSFQNATNELFERDILAIDLEKVDRIEVSATDKKLAFSGRGKGAGNELRWIRAGEGSEEDESASGWINRMLRLQIKSYASLEQNATIEDWPELLRFSFFQAGKKVEEMQIRSKPTATGESAEYRLKTVNTHAYVYLFDTRLETLLKDFQGLE